MKSEPVDPADYDDIIELIEIAQKIEEVDKDAGDDAELDLFCNLMNIDEDQSPANTCKIVKKEVVVEEPVVEPVAEAAAEPAAEPSVQPELQRPESPEIIITGFKKAALKHLMAFDDDVLINYVEELYKKQLEKDRMSFNIAKVKKEMPEVEVMKLEEELSAQHPPEASRRFDSRSRRDHRCANRRDTYYRDTRDRARDPGVMNGARFCLPRNDLAAEQRSRDDRRAAAVERERRRNDRRREDRRREERRQRRGHNDDDDRGRKRGGDRRDDEWPRRGDGKRRRD